MYIIIFPSTKMIKFVLLAYVWEAITEVDKNIM